MSENLETKINKLLEYGKSQLQNKGITTEPTSIRETLDRIAEIETEPKVYATTIRINQNGVNTITPEGDADGFSEVEIITEVDIKPNLQNKMIEITENGPTVVVADDGYDGLNVVEVVANVDTTINLQEKTVTENGYVTADEGYDGLSGVEVKVASSGGINPALIERTATKLLPEDLPGVTKIGDYAFSNFPLTEIELSEGITEIGQSAFAAYSEIDILVLPSTLTKIGTYAFAYKNIKSDLTISPNVEIIGASAFSIDSQSNQNFRYKTVTIYAKEIGSKAFYKNTSNPVAGAYAILGEGVEIVGDYAFSTNASSSTYNNGYGFTFKSQLPSTLTKIGGYAFKYCSFLKTHMGVDTLIIPDSVITLGQDAFANCGLSDCSVVVGSGITIIYGNTFKYFGYSYSSSNYPKTITFRGDITNIYASALQNTTFNKYDFSNCTSVPTLANTNAFSSIYGTWNIIVPDELYDTWIAATNWSTYASKIIKKSEDA